ncbi:MAG: AzlC family ABC transporter permease [Steroidobacteraceae bacterium]|jgi:predicted branched-subunit amino acid permease|nr:AzlC family ABC transporter permease [Steroidobacteraceae bacterium]
MSMPSPDLRPSRGTADERRAAFREGVRDYLPMLPALIAWGLVTGVALVQSGLTLAQAIGFSVTAFAASAQLATLPLIVGGVPLTVIVLTALMMNLRFVIYSAALKGSLQHVPFGRRMWYGYLTGDMGVVLYLKRMQRDPGWAARDAYFHGVATVNFAVWHVSSLAGIFAAAWIPRDWGLEFAGTVALIALLVPLCTRLPGAVATAIAATIGWATLHWPARLGLVVAIVAGIAAAVLVDRWRERRAAGPRR